MRVLITGGAGYVGTQLTAHLLPDEAIEEVIIYDNLSKGHKNFFLGAPIPHAHKIRVVQGDILDSRQLTKCMQQVDTVIHLAAMVTTPFANADPHYYEQVNHWGTAEVTYAAEETGIKRLIYLSSTSVYGARNEAATEDTLPSPQTFYGISKLRGEEHVRRLQNKMQTIIVRTGNVYGYSRSMRFDAVINRFMLDANFSNRIQIFGTGKQSRAFIHVNHLADILHQILLREDIPNGHYNLVDKNLQIFEVVDVLKDMYPTLEFLFSNQHMNLRDLVVSPESALYQYVNRFITRDLKEELLEFKSQFAF